MKTFSLLLYTKDLFFILAGGLFVVFQQSILSVTEGFFIALVLLASLMIGVYLQYRRDQDIIASVKRRADRDVEQKTEINRLKALFEDTYNLAEKERQARERLEKEIEQLKEEINRLKAELKNAGLNS